MPQRLKGMLCCDDSMNILSPRSWFVCAGVSSGPVWNTGLMCGVLLEGVVNKSTKNRFLFITFVIESGFIDIAIHMTIIRVKEQT